MASRDDRILPRYFLSRVRVSVRPRIFLYAKKLQKHSLRPITDRQRHHRQNGATRKAVHTFTPGGATYVTIHSNVSPSEGLFPFQLQRRQFPVRPAFAVTANKAQGQTLDAVGIHLGKDFFSHGQLYVSMSRVGDPGKLTLMSRHRKFPCHAGSYTDNVVYHEVL